MIKVKYKLLPYARAPYRATPGASGFDLYAYMHYEPEWHDDYPVPQLPPTVHMQIDNKQTHAVRTGLFVEVPKGYELQIRPRSGLARDKGLIVVNSPGTIDSDYRGEVIVLLRALGAPACISSGDRIAQAVICPVPAVEFEEVDELSDTERGEKGFGSTGI